MAFGATFDVSAPVEVYDQLLPEVRTAIGGPLGDGCLVHIVTPTDSGYRVVKVWESEQHWRRFRTEILTPSSSG
jgi:hypothetical protein